ncbi:MAG: TMEM175 family protein [Rudaea sp.]
MSMSVSSVMHIRRNQPTRLESFVDSAFAFAITLIVISVGHVPDTVADMLNALRDIPAFAVCFLLIARIWKSHRNWSRTYDLDDNATVWLSLLLVFVVLIYVYPLRILFSAMFGTFGHGWLSSQAHVVRSYFELRAAYVVFGIGYATIWGIFVLLYRHALKAQGTIGLSRAETEATRFHIALNLGFAVVAVLSIALAVSLPFETTPQTVALPGIIYFAMAPLSIGLSRYWRRHIAALAHDA